MNEVQDVQKSNYKERFFGKDFIKVSTLNDVATFTHNGNVQSTSAIFKAYKDKAIPDGLQRDKHYIILGEDEDSQVFFNNNPDISRNTKYLLTELGFRSLCNHINSEQSKMIVAETTEKAMTSVNLEVHAKSTDTLLNFLIQLSQSNPQQDMSCFAKTLEILASNQQYEMETIRMLAIEQQNMKKEVAKAKIEYNRRQLEHDTKVLSIGQSRWFTKGVDLLVVTDETTKEQYTYNVQYKLLNDFCMSPGRLHKIVDEKQSVVIDAGDHEGKLISIKKVPIIDNYKEQQLAVAN